MSREEGKSKKEKKIAKQDFSKKNKEKQGFMTESEDLTSLKKLLGDSQKDEVLKKEPKKEKEVSESKPVSKKKAAPKKKPASFSLEEVARRRVKNYKEHWLPSIDSFAKSQGFQQPASEEECVAILKKWGAHIL